MWAEVRGNICIVEFCSLVTVCLTQDSWSCVQTWYDAQCSVLLTDEVARRSGCATQRTTRGGLCRPPDVLLSSQRTIGRVSFSESNNVVQRSALYDAGWRSRCVGWRRCGQILYRASGACNTGLRASRRYVSSSCSNANRCSSRPPAMPPALLVTGQYQF